MIFQHIADGILSGAIIALGAIGLSFTMRILRFANFSHSELVTWGAYFALVFLGALAATGGGVGAKIGPFSFGWPLLVALIVSAVATSATALVLHEFVYARLSKTAGHMTMVFASFGIALLLRHLIVLIFGPAPIYYSNELQFALILPGGVRVMPDQVF
ncbi:MAG: branched-chain amino acid ABC transporter permease, partial [Pseudomonadota bacterium]